MEIHMQIILNSVKVKLEMWKIVRAKFKRKEHFILRVSNQIFQDKLESLKLDSFCLSWKEPSENGENRAKLESFLKSP